VVGTLILGLFATLFNFTEKRRSMQPEPANKVQDFFTYFNGKQQFFSLPNKAETGFYGEYTRNVEGLLRDNEKGKDIYFTVNETKPGIKRTKDRYLRTRAVHIDDDGKDKHGGLTGGFPLQPNIVVSTSPGKFHYYWLTSTDDGDMTEAVLRGMARDYNGDPNTCDRTRIMRAPGFIHTNSGHTVTYEVLSNEPYSWDTIVNNFPPMLETLTPEFKEYDKPAFSVAEAIAGILSGEDVHGSRVSLSMHWANSGMPKEDALATLIGYVEDAMRGGAIDKGRAMERLANMKQAVHSAYKKVAKEQEAPKYEPERTPDAMFTKVPKANGNLEMIIQDIMSFMVHPSYEMATVVAQHCVSVFGGGIYHLNGKTCTRKRTILAPTGRGKSISNRYFSEVIRNMAMRDDMFNPYTFVGGSHYAANNVHMELAEHRVRSYITSEAGLMGKSGAGTTHETRAYFLNVIAGDYSEGFSGRQLSAKSAENRKTNESLKTIYSAMPVLLSESVPDQYVDVLKTEDAFRSGDVGREELFFIDPHKGLPNRTINRIVNPKVIDILFDLARQFEATDSYKGDNPSNPDKFMAADDSAVEDELYELLLSTNEDYNAANIEQSHISLALSSRYYEKVLTTCLVQAIADVEVKVGKLAQPVITKAHLQYALDYHDALKVSLISQASGTGALSDPFEQCIARVIKFAEEFGQRNRDMKEAHDFTNKIISRSWITYVLDRANFRPMDNYIRSMRNNRIAAFKEIVQALEDKRVLLPITNIKAKTPLWKINL